MADSRKRKIHSGTEDKRKSAKTCNNEDVEDDERTREYRQMLQRVAEHLGRGELKKLCGLQSIKANDKERIIKENCCDPLELFVILEERGKLGVSNVSSLLKDLTSIGHEDAVQLIHDYQRNDRAEFEIPSEPESDYEDSKQSSARQFEDVLKDIGLEDKFPGKLRLEDFVKLNGNHLNVVYSFWRKITCLDYWAGLPQSLSFHDGIECSMRDFIFSILHCADDFLRQDILEKLSACQLAIPLLLSSVKSDGSPIFLRWACGTILKKWKGKHDSFAVEQPVISHPLFTVSFLRIGEVGISKSRLLNYMLGKNQGYGSHPYFLTKECDQVQPKLSLGSIESVWFLPTAGSENEIFKDAMTFLNLRGDCLNYPKQREFACKVANLTVVLVSTDKKEDFRDLLENINTISRHALFVSIRETENASGKIHETGQWRFVKRYQIKPLSEHLCKHIVTICEPKEERIVLSDFDATIVNEDGKKSDIQTATKSVDAMFTNTKHQGILSFKNENFPLQAHWEKITNLHKERFAFDADDNKTFEEKREKKKQNVKMYRSQQLKCKQSNAMTHFLNAVKKSSTRESFVKYFLGMLHVTIVKMVGESANKDMEKINSLEDERKKLMEMNDTASNQGEDEMKMELKSQEKMKERDRERCKNLSTECKKLYEYCRVNNLGCEHFLREIGQQYEAYIAASSADLQDLDTTVFPIYPTIAAELILQMQSFELMDGDTECVPITWVTAVLDALRRKLNNPKVVVVSVVGVQSSGKSTLLNSMFGLRFPVRAGRCTRGLFMRLLKADESLVKDLGFEYMIIVDTEGLRSIEHDGHTFDNELVTFALSIANVTIFNISEENISADVAGVLQIAAHALIRMKEVDLECKCLIIQQRVSDLTAAVRNKTNTHKIIETLNEATKFAAEEEGLEGRYKKISDVVELKFDEDLQYVPNLWPGGMAPPNRMYGEKVTKIRESLLQDIRKGKINADLTLSTFTDRVRDVWSAVKEENFIFSFQDSVRAVAFNQFCLEYNRWLVEMRQAIMNISLHCLKMIPALVHKGSDIEELKSLLDTEEDRQSNLLRKQIEEYIAAHPRKVMISKYKQGFLDDVNIALKDAKSQALQMISEEYDIRKLERNLPKLGGKWLARMITDVKELAQHIRSSGESSNLLSVTGMDTGDSLLPRNPYELTKLDPLWKKWTKDIKKESGITQINITPSDMKTLCDKLLLKTTRNMAIGSEIQNLFKKEGGIEKHIGTVDFCKYINDKHVKAWIKGKQKSAKSETGSCERQYEPLGTDQIVMEKQIAAKLMREYVAESIKELKLQERHYFDKNMFQLLVRKTLRNLSEKTDDNRKLPHSLIAKGLMHLCARAFDEVFRHVMIRDDNFSTFFAVEDKMVRQQFHRFCYQEEMKCSLSEFIFYYIEKGLKKQLKNCVTSIISKHNTGLKLPWDILSSMSWRFMSLLNKRYSVQSDYYSSLHVGNLPRLMTMYDEQLRDDEINRVIDKAIISLVKWENDFSKNLSFKNWIDEIMQTFSTDSSVQEAINIYDRVQPMEVSPALRVHIETWRTRNNAYEILYPSLGIESLRSNFCREVCPMCGMFCDNTMETHTKHSSHLHQPRGIGGEMYPGTKRMVLEDCSISILHSEAICTRTGKTFHCKDYKKHHEDWEIKADKTNPGKIFWRWFYVQLAKKYFKSSSDRIYTVNSNYVEFPESWLNITEAEALQSLQDDKKMKVEGRRRGIQSEEANPCLFTNSDSPQSDTSTVVREFLQPENDSDTYSDGSREEGSRSSLE